MSVAEFADEKNLPYMPASKLTAGITICGEKMNYIKKPFISLVGRNYFEQKNVASFESTTAGYFLLDLHMGASFVWGRQMFDVSISGSNLLNNGYYNHLSMMKDIKPAGIREMGRNIAINLKVPFGIIAN